MKFWMHRDTFILWGMRISSAIILAIFALGFYWLVLDRSQPVFVERGEVDKYERQEDGSWIVFVRWYGVRERACWGNSKRWLTGDAVLPLVLPLQDIAYPPDIQDRPLGPYQWEVPLHIPAYFTRLGQTSGSYRIRILYSCNPLQEYLYPIVVEPPPVRFQLPLDTAPFPSRPPSTELSQ